jgi:hypothetical protein
MIWDNSFLSNKFGAPSIDAGPGTAVVLDGNTTIFNASMMATNTPMNGTTPGIMLKDATLTALGPVNFLSNGGNCHAAALAQLGGVSNFYGDVWCVTQRGAAQPSG